MILVVEVPIFRISQTKNEAKTSGLLTFHDSCSIFFCEGGGLRYINSVLWNRFFVIWWNFRKLQSWGNLNLTTILFLYGVLDIQLFKIYVLYEARLVHVWSHGEVTNVSLRATTFDILGGKHSLNLRTMKRTDDIPKKIQTKQCGDGSKPIKCHIWGDGHPFYIILPVVCITILGIPWGLVATFPPTGLQDLVSPPGSRWQVWSGSASGGETARCFKTDPPAVMRCAQLWNTWTQLTQLCCSCFRWERIDIPSISLTNDLVISPWAHCGANIQLLEDLAASAKADSPLMEAGMDSWKPNKLVGNLGWGWLWGDCDWSATYPNLIYLEKIEPHVGFNSTTYPQHHILWIHLQYISICK